MLQADLGIAFATLELLDDSGGQVYSGCLGCGDPGDFVLAKGGAYTLRITPPDDGGTGAYQVVVASVRVHFLTLRRAIPLPRASRGRARAA